MIQSVQTNFLLIGMVRNFVGEVLLATWSMKWAVGGRLMARNYISHVSHILQLLYIFYKPPPMSYPIILTPTRYAEKLLIPGEMPGPSSFTTVKELCFAALLGAEIPDGPPPDWSIVHLIDTNTAQPINRNHIHSLSRTKWSKSNRSRAYRQRPNPGFEPTLRRTFSLLRRRMIHGEW